jgi:hypothetical protein
MSNAVFQHFQRDVVRGVEGYIVTGSKQVEIGGLVKVLKLFVVFYIEFQEGIVVFYTNLLCSTGTRFSEDSRKYGAENTCTSGNTLSKAAVNYANARAQMEKERGNLLKALGTQV